MTNIGTWLAGMMQPLIARIMVALGLNMVAIVGVDTAIGQLKTLVLQRLGEVPAVGLQMALLGGVGTAIGMIFGAITFRLVLWQAQNSMKLLGVAS